MSIFLKILRSHLLLHISLCLEISLPQRAKHGLHHYYLFDEERQVYLTIYRAKMVICCWSQTWLISFVAWHNTFPKLSISITSFLTNPKLWSDQRQGDVSQMMRLTSPGIPGDSSVSSPEHKGSALSRQLCLCFSWDWYWDFIPHMHHRCRRLKLYLTWIRITQMFLPSFRNKKWSYSAW